MNEILLCLDKTLKKIG